VFVVDRRDGTDRTLIASSSLSCKSDWTTKRQPESPPHPKLRRCVPRPPRFDDRYLLFAECRGGRSGCDPSKKAFDRPQPLRGLLTEPRSGRGMSRQDHLGSALFGLNRRLNLS